MRYLITYEVQAVLGPMVERRRSPHVPAPGLPDRVSFEAVLYLSRVGCPWLDQPAEFGDWSAVYDGLYRF